MVLKAYSIRDAKAEAFNPPFYGKTHGEAERSFRKLANDQQSMLASNPEDFDLFHIGEFDDNSGKFTPLVTPQHILKAIQAIRQVEN